LTDYLSLRSLDCDLSTQELMDCCVAGMNGKE
jgi:hypothetical protein